ncbi:MAG: hypothetical protein HYR76_04360 [Ignavibacteria bacterium]|nr:hypothetical protein [Ignavibacteria bacterium]
MIDPVNLIYRDDITTRSALEQIRVKGYLVINSDVSSIINEKVGLYRVFLADLDGDGVPAPNGTVIRFEKYKAILDGDEKVFTTVPVEITNPDAAKKEVARINVFPNPYYGVNRAELNRFRRYVTFNHLPPYAKIRIFNLAGILVRTIVKQDNPSQRTQFATWDLNNENGLPIASGMYIAYVELRDANGVDLGTKTLKLMIVLEQQFLDSF